MKTTKKHFEIYKKECLRLVKEFGLTGWDLLIVHEDLKGDVALCSTNLSSRSAKLSLTTNWGVIDPLNTTTLKETALHEVTHLLAARLVALASARYATESEIDDAYEEISNKMVSFMRYK